MSLLGAIFGSATVILLVSSVGYFFTKLYEARMLVRDKQKKGQVGLARVQNVQDHRLTSISQ